MSDIIKFRAWDTSRNTMTNPFVLGSLNAGDCFDGWYWKVMLFTGLFDKNNREIYEGDIVINGLSGTWIVGPLEGGSFSLIGICEKYDGCNFLISALNDHVEIIGNIYENPELFTKGGK